MVEDVSAHTANIGAKRLGGQERRAKLVEKRAADEEMEILNEADHADWL